MKMNRMLLWPAKMAGHVKHEHFMFRKGRTQWTHMSETKWNGPTALSTRARTTASIKFAPAALVGSGHHGMKSE